MRNFIGMIFVCLMFVVFQANAHATLVPSWVADGVREVAFANSATVLVLPVKVEGFSTSELCQAYIDEQNDLELGNNLKGYPTTGKVIAACSQQR